MNKDELYSFIKSMSIMIPLITGLVRFKALGKTYLPFLIYLIVGFITEVGTFTYFIVSENKSNAVISNIYVLIEWFLILWQFDSWGFFKTRKVIFYVVLTTVTLLWVVENVVLEELHTDFVPFYRVLYSFVIVLISVNVINYTIIHDNRSIFRNARFIICLGFIIFFIYKLLFEWAYQYSIINKLPLSRNIIIKSFGNVNILQKLMCGAALLFVQKNEKRITD